jgi:hypothetical protein
MYQSISSFRVNKSCLFEDDYIPKDFKEELNNEVMKYTRVASLQKIHDMENKHHI